LPTAIAAGEIERSRTTRQRLTDPAVAEDAECLAREVRPRRRRRAADGPLAFPRSAPERRVDPAEAPRQGEHRADHVLGDGDFVAVDVRERRRRGQRRAVDAIEPGAGHLDQLQPLRARGHLAGEDERDQDVDVGQAWNDADLVAQDHAARGAQARAHRGLERGRERSGKCDLEHGYRPPVASSTGPRGRSITSGIAGLRV
jgi:hypothetical protein